MIQRVTFGFVEKMRQLMGLHWDSEAQRICMKEICEHDKIIYQAHRQHGKSWNCGLLGGCYALAAGIPIIAAPTLTQAALIIFSDIKAHAEIGMRVINDGKVFRKDPDRATHIKYSHGGGIIALSAADTSTNPTEPGAQVEGWHGNLLIIDEGHRVRPEFAGLFSPMLNRARLEGTAKTIILGVGGHKSMAIEAMKTRGYHHVFMPASRAVEYSPELAPIFEAQKQELSDWEYRMMYECLPVTEGMRKMFPAVPVGIDVSKFRALNMRSTMWFGIDVGKRKDATIVKAIEQWGDVMNEVDELEIPGMGVDYTVQAPIIYNWINNRFIWSPNRITIELNGPGEGLRDILNQDAFFGRTGSIQGITTTADLKYQMWNLIGRLYRDNRLGVESPDARAHYEGLMYEIKINGTMEFEHSDPYMAQVMAIIGMSQVTAF